MKAEEVLEKYGAGSRAFSTLNLREANLSGVNLSGADLSRADLSVANFTGANLSQTNLSQAKLNVAKLNGTNLSKANLTGANLNVANLTLADLTGADLTNAELIKAELTRAELSGAILKGANLSNADLRDVKLRYADLRQANLSRANLRHAVLTSASLEQANLTSSDLSGADLTGVDLTRAELRQTNLSRTNLQGANLSGANLRWADLSGADLRWADLSGTKLSGANLTGANLSHAILLDATLVHVDLTRANLAGADWAGADLSGSTLTGVKLHAVPPYGVKTEGATCRWIDLSLNGDQSRIYQFLTDDCREYFNETPPTVQIVVDDRLNTDAHCGLAVTYQQIARQCGALVPPPNLTVRRRRTTLAFELERDEQLFIAAYIAIFPFEDARFSQKNILELIQQIPTQEIHNSLGNGSGTGLGNLRQFQKLVTRLSQQTQQVDGVKLLQSIPIAIKKIPFFQSPTKVTLLNSNNQALTIYHSPKFGKHSIPLAPAEQSLNLPLVKEFELPSVEEALAFIRGFHHSGRE
jgi:uncharacterized protein YjbI with pentapeptide repeats